MSEEAPRLARFSIHFRILLLSLIALAIGTGRAAEGASDKVSVLTDVRYESPSGPQVMDIYLPNVPEQNPGVPCIIWIRNDSTAGPRDISVCEDLAVAGFVAASINFKPNGTPSTAAVVACKSAVRFIRASAVNYHVDGRRIGIAGSSMGGAFALLVAFTGHEPRFEVTDVYPGVSDRVSLAVSLSGVTDWLKMPQTVPNAAIREQLRSLAPVTYVSADAPAVLLFHGTTDKAVAYEQAVDLEKLLAKYRVPHQLVLLDRVGHTYNLTTANGRPLPQDVKSILVSFLRAHLTIPQ